MSSPREWGQPAVGLAGGSVSFFCFGIVNCVLYFRMLAQGEHPYLGLALGTATGLSVAAVLAYCAAGLVSDGRPRFDDERPKFGIRRVVFSALLGLITCIAIILALWLVAGRDLG